MYCKSCNLPNADVRNYSIDLRQFLRHPVYLLCDTDGPGERQDTKTSSRPRRSVSGSAGETPPTTCTGTLPVLRPYIASVAMKDILNSCPNFEKAKQPTVKGYALSAHINFKSQKCPNIKLHQS